ncbi:MULTISPECIES: hypothetical protein [unclassified Synechocystis]|uniref:hypothetical protein n=1 Tax=unclassified Synechocystis TaxID=2640012 RepID=UPI000300EAAB|nr:MULTISPECIES: hypothetical protein [unclassified Synechocystis]MBD2619163.1 hypothetical protein [Synechocystis sp. FACHB-898]MBD2639549.1 hypothetical protein [Synechocystis sp. FACHB-908]NHL99072.1 hypothetical protein [Synechocystis sp. PCC 6803]UOO10667.1 hypothetical protein MT986_11190 [Synechocystis sp. PCC 6803]
MHSRARLISLRVHRIFCLLPLGQNFSPFASILTRLSLAVARFIGDRLLIRRYYS